MMFFIHYALWLLFLASAFWLACMGVGALFRWLLRRETRRRAYRG